jgi:hypothetical protein
MTAVSQDVFGHVSTQAGIVDDFNGVTIAAAIITTVDVFRFAVSYFGEKRWIFMSNHAILLVCLGCLNESFNHPFALHDRGNDLEGHLCFLPFSITESRHRDR